MSSPASGTDVLDLCVRVYAAADGWARQDHRARWVMDPGWYKRLRGAAEVATDRDTDPETWIPDPGDTLFGIRISVRADGGEPHLEAPARPAGAFVSDARDVAMELARKAYAPPPLGQLAAGTMLAVAPVPGKILEEWRHADLGCWIAWPHAADAVHAEEMTAAQLRALLAARDHG